MTARTIEWAVGDCEFQVVTQYYDTNGEIQFDVRSHHKANPDNRDRVISNLTVEAAAELRDALTEALEDAGHESKNTPEAPERKQETRAITQFFAPEHMTQIATFYAGLQALIKQCDLDPIGTSKGDLFVNTVDIMIRHADHWNIGRFKLEDDMLVFDLDVPEDDQS